MPEPVGHGPRPSLGCGVIGSPTGSGPVSLGSSPGTPAQQCSEAHRPPHELAGLSDGTVPSSGPPHSTTAPSSSGLGRRPLKAVAPVRIRSGLPTSTSTPRLLTWRNEGQGPCCVSGGVRSGPAVSGYLCPIRARGAVSDGRLTAVRPPAFRNLLATEAGDVLCSWSSSRPGRMRVVAAGARHLSPLFTRQQRIVHGVLASAVLAAQVGGVVQPVRSCGAEYCLVE